jgi:hypothetical protein
MRGNCVSFNAAKYATEVSILREEFKSRFQDFRNHKTSIQIFELPFELHVQAVPEKFQIKLIYLQSREEMKSKFLNASVLKLFKLHLPKNDFPQLSRHSIHVGALFGSTYYNSQ